MDGDGDNFEGLLANFFWSECLAINDWMRGEQDRILIIWD